MKHKILIISVLILGFAITGCTNKDKEKIIDTIENFTDAFYSGDINKAMDYCTPQAAHSLKFNEIIIEEDVKSIMENSKHTITFNNISIDKKNNTAEVVLILENFFDISTMCFEKSDTTTYSLIKIDKIWYIK